MSRNKRSHSRSERNKRTNIRKDRGNPDGRKPWKLSGRTSKVDLRDLPSDKAVNKIIDHINEALSRSFVNAIDGIEFVHGCDEGSLLRGHVQNLSLIHI